MFHILFPYKLFVSLSSTACKGSRTGTIKALTVSSPNTVNECLWHTRPRAQLSPALLPSLSFPAGRGARLPQEIPTPLPTRLRGQTMLGGTGQKLGSCLRKLSTESKFFHASHEVKHLSILPQKYVLHYNSLEKCRKRRFGSFLRI